jgi:transcriptional regulator with GAF, ATPase, and Fis domain
MTGRHALRQPTPSLTEEAFLVREQRLAQTFVELADTLVEDFDVMEFLYTLAERCVELLDVSAVGLMFGDEQGRLRVAASSSEETRLLELSQLQNNEGPCLECYLSGEPVAESDLSSAQMRWPRFAPEAVRAGFRTVHALPMRLRERTVGSLNLFHVDANALSTATTDIAQSLVDVATIGLIQVEGGNRWELLHTQLHLALDARVVIEQAKGMLAEMEHMTPARALTALRENARRKNLRLIDVARAVIEREPLDAAITMGSSR